MINFILVKVLHIKQWVSSFTKKKTFIHKLKKMKFQKQEDQRGNAKDTRVPFVPILSDGVLSYINECIV